jgi:hypothetical protein
MLFGASRDHPVTSRQGVSNYAGKRTIGMVLLSAMAWTRAGHVSAGAVVLGILARALLHGDLVGRAGSASTMQELIDTTNTYSRRSEVLLFFVGCAALVALVALLEVRAARTGSTVGDTAAKGCAAVAFVAGALAVWRVWHTPSPAGGSANVLVAGNAIPSSGDVAALVAAAGRPVPHTGVFGVIIVCLLAASYVLSLRRTGASD